MPITVTNLDKESKILSTLIGRTIIDINYDGLYSAPITLLLDNGKSVYISAAGDDMAHTIIEE